MRSEFQYFMNENDHALFDEFLSSVPEIKIKPGKNFDEILYLDGNIQYERSELLEDVLTGGRIAIATTDLDGNYNFYHYKETERLYGKLRNWLKKRSKNTLICFNEGIDNGTIMPVNNFWLLGGAESQVRANEIKLKQFKSGNVVFILR